MFRGNPTAEKAIGGEFLKMKFQGKLVFCVEPYNLYD
jgi:hypothetical protein